MIDMIIFLLQFIFLSFLSVAALSVLILILVIGVSTYSALKDKQ